MNIRALRFDCLHTTSEVWQPSRLSQPLTPTIWSEAIPELPRNFRITPPRASANACVQVSEPLTSHDPTIRIRVSWCCRSQTAARFSVFFPATVRSSLFGSNRIGCLRKGGFESDTDAGCTTVAEVSEWLSPEVCRAMRVPEGASLGLPVLTDSACKTEGQAIRVCLGDMSPARRTEVPNIKMFEYALTKK